MFNALRGMVRRSWGDEGQQSGSRAGISTGQTNTLRAAAVASFRQFNTASSLGWLRQQTSNMDDSSPTNTITITSRRDQTDITQLTSEPATQDWNSHAARHQDQDGGRLRARTVQAWEGPRTLAGGTSTTRKHGRAHLRGLVRHQPGPYTRSFHLCTRRSNTHTQPSRNTTATQPRRRSTQIPTIRTTQQRLPWSCFCDSGLSKKPDQQQTHPQAGRSASDPTTQTNEMTGPRMDRARRPNEATEATATAPRASRLLL